MHKKKCKLLLGIKAEIIIKEKLQNRVNVYLVELCSHVVNNADKTFFTSNQNLSQ